MNYYSSIGLGVFVIIVSLSVVFKADNSIELHKSYAVERIVEPLEPIIQEQDLQTAIEMQQRDIMYSNCPKSLKKLKENHIILMESQQQTTDMLNEAIELKAKLQARMVSPN